MKGFVRAKNAMLEQIRKQLENPKSDRFILGDLNETQLATVYAFVASFNDNVIGDEYRSPEREAAYAAIDGERDYQEHKWPAHTHTPTEFLVYVVDYAQEALHLVSRNSDAQVGDKVLHNVRKIGALAVCCMEQNGAITRGEEQGTPRGHGGKQHFVHHGTVTGRWPVRAYNPDAYDPSILGAPQPEAPDAGWYMGHSWGGGAGEG